MLTHITRTIAGGWAATRPQALLSYAFLALLSCASGSADDQTRERVVAEATFETLKSQHFAPQDLNDDFSKRAFDAYLKNLDVNKRFLLEADVATLRKRELEIDDDIKSGNFALMREAEGLLAQRTKDVQAFYEELLKEPFDFTKDETIEFDYDKRHFAKDLTELREEWRKYIKYQVAVQVVQKLQAGGKQHPLSQDSIRARLTPELEAKAREAVLKSNKDFFKRLSQINESDRLSEFLNSLTHLYDPHTDFYAPASKDNFDIQLSGKLEGIGATLNQKDGYITVAAIVAGSAAWKEGHLKVNDQILKVAQDKGEPVDVTDMRLDDAIKLIRGKKGTRVVLTVRKPEGAIKDIAIVRDVVQLEETFAKSAVLKNTDGSLVGYINLPSFYVDFNSSNGRRCSDDVKEEIKKVMAGGAKSIIFDLRNNGGGSLQDVVRIAGFFIDEGPVVQVKSRSNGVSVMNDRDAGQLFSGPLVVLVNPFSASASEIFAAAIQDYNRGLIVGSLHTFGKGTVQQIIDLDQVVPYQYNQYKPLGSVKLTTQKFYRVNGGATQLRGVSSDIMIPDLYRYLKFGEKELENTLPWDQITPARYNTYRSNTSRFKKTIEEANKRVGESAYFAQVDAGAKRLQKRQDEQNFTLNVYKYMAEVEQNEAEEKKLKELSGKLPKVVVQQPVSVEATSDTLATARRKSFTESIQKDAYIYEAMQVIKGL